MPGVARERFAVAEQRRKEKSGRAWTRRGLALAALLSAVRVAAAVDLAATPVELDLTGGPMAATLIEIGQLYSVIVSFKPGLVERHVAPPIRGSHTLLQALHRVLHGSPLVADITPEGIVTLRAGRPSTGDKAHPDGAPSDAPESATTSEARGAGYVLQPVIVYGKGDGLRAWSSAGATLTDTPLAQLPQAVSVVTRDALELAQAQSQIEAMDYVTGVTLQTGLAPQTGVAGKVRGFPVQYSVSAISSLRGAFGVDGAFIERIEVYKGPSAAVGGVADYSGRGGVIEVVRKQPRPGRQYEITWSAGSQDGGTLRSTFDVGAGSGDTLWRLVGYGMRSGRTDAGYSARHGDGLLGAVQQRVDAFSATMTWQQDRRRETPPALTHSVRTSTEPDLAIASGQDEPVSQEDGTQLRFDDAQLDLEWRLSGSWRVKAKTRWGHGQVDARRHLYLPDRLFVTFDRHDIRMRENARQWTLVGEVDTGPVKHKLLLGKDAQVQRLASGSTSAGWLVDPEVFMPGRTALPDTPAFGDPLALIDMGRWRYWQSGLLLQDQLGIGPLQLRLAMRRVIFGEVWEDLEVRSVTGNNWEVGATWQLSPSTVVYAGAQSALEAAFDSGLTLFDGSTAPAHRTRQVQAGWKADLLDDRLSVMLEAFRMRRFGGIGHSAALEGSQAYVMPGDESKGVELEAVGRLSPSVDVALGLSLIRARVRSESLNDATIGEAPATATPPRSMHLLARYRLPDRDTSIGMALRAWSHTWAASPDPDQIFPALREPGGARLDLSWKRMFGSGSFGVSVCNVLDRRLYGASTDTDFVPLLPRRSLRVTLSVSG